MIDDKVSRRARSNRPRVVFLDPDHWDTFEFLASALRKRGIDVVHVSPLERGASMTARAMVRLLFGASHGNLPDADPAALARLNDWLAPPTVDVQGPETLVEHLRGVARWPDTRTAQRTSRPDLVPLLYNKAAMGDFAQGLGLQVPKAWPQRPTDVLPIVVKGAVGSGGQTVRVAHDSTGVDEAVAELDPHGEDLVFFQQFEPGHIVVYGGVASSGRILAGGSYRTVPAPDHPLGPAECITRVSIRSIDREIAVLVEALDYSGFFCADYVTRPDGTGALIDFNPRVFGSWLALQETGVNLLDAYLSLFGLADEPDPTPPGDGQTGMVRHLPGPDARANWAGLRRETGHTVASLRRVRRITGPRYVAAGAIRGSARLAAAAGSLAASGLRTRRSR